MLTILQIAGRPSQSTIRGDSHAKALHEALTKSLRTSTLARAGTLGAGMKWRSAG
jgi:hypothetical protein